MSEQADRPMTLDEEVRRLTAALSKAEEIIAAVACLADPDIGVRPDVEAKTRRAVLAYAKQMCDGWIAAAKQEAKL